MAQIPVTSVAFKQLPLPGLLGKMLLGMAAGATVIGGIGIAAAAGREAALPPGRNGALGRGFFQRGP